MAAFNRVARNVLQKSPNDVVLLSAVRTPINRSFKGGYKDAWPEDILIPALQAAVQRAKIEASDVNDAMIGNVLAELGFAKTGRMALNHAGFPNSTTFHTVNRQCSSSLQAITHLSHSIMVGQIDVGLAGGVECMSRNYGSRGIPADVSPTLQGSQVKDARDCLMPMGITSENVAERYGVDRKSQDEYAVRSHSRASRAQKEGRFDWEIVPVTLPRIDEATGQPTGFEVSKDDGIRHGLTYEKVSTLKPVFGENGKSTAGNSSQISDGASATILARRSWAEERGLTPLGRFVGTQVKGCAPDEMGIGPIYAIPALLKYTGVDQKDVDIIELNEAFASQTLQCIRALGLDEEKVNPNGGAIALGHPTGATGARQTATLFGELRRQDKEIGMVSMCASTGQGVASLFIRES
ncbi:Thiolase, N-terminal domain-domain-containing protein [Clohesyomyces aquaticus]|uniref:Thiolase, N-terminal domain-domain-containing protein n=1 Tax=Clohesyomyces aquaticus TaxID=1231657 RepID=A0A1Y1Z6R7_9PLEO|nr:Thiolase, N-terminal domain-domain-containing protein [Clohesyomyces aquaticus]